MLRPDAGAAVEISDEMLTGACVARAGTSEPELGALKTVHILCSDAPCGVPDGYLGASCCAHSTSEAKAAPRAVGFGVAPDPPP